VVIKKLIFLFVFLLFFINKDLQSSQILDYETELFINELINEIKVANKIDKKLRFKILSDHNINAFVDQNNIIYITSGLIENCDDYIALLSVIAHEIGHIDKNHVKNRIVNINKSKNISSFTNLSIIASSLILKNTEILKGIAVSSGTLSEYNIKFNKDQEREADYYSLMTLKKLNLYSESITKLLLKIEKKSLERGFSKEKMKYSTHPYFEERIDIINYLNQNKGIKLDKSMNLKYKFIQAKFIGYNENEVQINNLDNSLKVYANAILSAKKGNLKESLINLNKLISLNKNNYFLIETKADILFSYGYVKESIKFYQKVLEKHPNNNYAQIRVLENINLQELSKNDIENLFLDNLNLLKKYYNNKNLLLIYLKLSNFSNKKDWIEFLDYWLNKQNNQDIIINNLYKFKQSNDIQLSNLVQLIYNDYR
tara:strand:+ start:206 stop:1489 length:1284 start_codon:yes stop_codon:yes gene_type:complete